MDHENTLVIDETHFKKRDEESICNYMVSVPTERK